MATQSQPPREPACTYVGLKTPDGVYVLPTADRVTMRRPDGRALWAEVYVDHERLVGYGPATEEDA